MTSGYCFAGNVVLLGACDVIIATEDSSLGIGGPAMIRSAAKNHESVTIVTDAEDYGAVMDDMAENDGATTAALRRRLASIGRRGQCPRR